MYLNTINYSFILFIIFLGYIFSQKAFFIINLRSLDEYCLSEYFPDKTLVIYEIYSNNKKTRIQLKYENEIRVVKTLDKLLLPITTEKGGDFELCITNLDKINSTVTFSLKYGIGAKDYSSLARAKDLKPSDIIIEKLNDRAKDLSKRISFSQSNEKNFEKILDNISSKIMIFSFVIISIMIIIGWIEMKYLQNFMRRRKII